MRERYFVYTGNEYYYDTNGYVEKYEDESAQAVKLQNIRDERKKKAEKISAFMFEIHERDGLLERFDEKLWLTTIESVQVQHDGSLVFRFNSGMEVTK